MSTDPATFVAGVPVKISEKFRPPRRVTIPASCQHQINPDLLTQEYDFAVEKTALNWLQERRTRREKEERERKERIAEYDRKKAERKAKEEEEERIKKEKEEEERQRILREEEEKRKQEEDRRHLEEERKKEEEQTQDMKDVVEDGDDEECVKNQTAEADSDEPGRKTPSTSQENLNADSQQLQPNTQESTPGTPNLTSENTYPTNSTMQTTNAVYKTDSGTSYDWMLKPTPIPSQKNSVKSPLKTPANINFADFEGEGNDPFDSAALKSINDMEELAKVLDSSNLGQRSGEGNSVVKQNSNEEGRSHVNTYNNGQVPYSTYGQYPYYVQQQQQLQQQQQQQNMAQSRQGFGQYPSHMGKSSQVTTAPSTVSSYSTGSQYGGDPSRSFQNTYYPQQWNNGFNVSSPSKAAQYVPYDYRLQASNVPSSVASTTQGGVMSPVSNTGSTSTIPISTNSGFPTLPSVDRGTTPGKRPDLEDFYSRYYSQNKAMIQQNQHSGGQSGESTPSHSSSSGAAGSTSGSLRSSRSVPDLTAAEDSEVTRYSSGIQSSNEGRGFSHTPPPRPSSTGLTGLEDWKPLPDISDLPETLSNQHLYQSGLPSNPPVPPPYTPVKSRLPDPFTELTTDAQALVQSMAEMGFPRPRVARAVQKLGTDHKKLIEVLLVLQSLQENGEDGYKAERAFYHYLGDVQKTRDHLAAAKQLLDLGFEEERIVDALLKHNNDRDKALEELIA